MVTIKDIASYTGVSCTTISNVIHGRSSRVSPETIERVNAAIAELGYTPNMSARSLVSKSSKVVAFINHVIIREGTNVMEDPFHSTTIGLIEHKLQQDGYYLMLRTISTPEELIHFLQNWSIDGLFITGIFEDAFYKALSSYHIPTVLIDSYVRHSRLYNVGLEDFKGSHLATSHLIEKGHRRIGFSSPLFRDGGVLQERFLGYKAALTEHGIPFDPSICFEYEMDSMESCQAAADDIADNHPDLTGLVACADQMAAGIMAGLHKRSVRIPEDISIVGFDDISLSQMVYPQLTTIHQDMHRKAECAADTMLQLLAGNKPADSNVILPVSLVERDSVRALC